MKNLFDKATSSISHAAESTKKTVTDTLTDATQLGRKAAFIAESKAISARDSVLDGASEISGAAAKFGGSIVSTVVIMTEVGVVVSAVVAPVPTFIGVALLWLLTDQIHAGSKAVDKAVQQGQDKRKFERLTGLLKKYGQIPETATLETEMIQMKIDSVTGEVTGSVLVGEFKGRDFASLSSEDVNRLRDHAPDADTKSILESYRSLVDARA